LAGCKLKLSATIIERPSIDFRISVGSLHIQTFYDLSGNIRPEAIVGAWEVDRNGDIIGDFISNKNYRECS
jgi:hypothetical protein